MEDIDIQNSKNKSNKVRLKLLAAVLFVFIILLSLALLHYRRTQTIDNMLFETSTALQQTFPLYHLPSTNAYQLVCISTNLRKKTVLLESNVELKLLLDCTYFNKNNQRQTITIPLILNTEYNGILQTQIMFGYQHNGLLSFLVDDNLINQELFKKKNLKERNQRITLVIGEPFQVPESVDTAIITGRTMTKYYTKEKIDAFVETGNADNIQVPTLDRSTNVVLPLKIIFGEL